MATKWQQTRGQWVYLTNGSIETDLHVKPMDTHPYLCTDSCHPKHYKTTITYGQALHLRTICSEQLNLLKQCRELKNNLLNQGCDEQQLNPEIQWALDIPTNWRACSYVNDQEKSAWIPLVIMHHPTLPSFAAITRRYHHILHISHPLMIANISRSLCM